jgi:hypothetical protein
VQWPPGRSGTEDGDPELGMSLKPDASGRAGGGSVSTSQPAYDCPVWSPPLPGDIISGCAQAFAPTLVPMTQYSTGPPSLRDNEFWTDRY